MIVKLILCYYIDYTIIMLMDDTTSSFFGTKCTNVFLNFNWKLIAIIEEYESLKMTQKKPMDK